MKKTNSKTRERKCVECNKLMKIQFEAEVKEVKASKTASMDKEMRVILITDSEEVLKLQSVIARDTVKVEVSYE